MDMVCLQMPPPGTQQHVSSVPARKALLESLIVRKSPVKSQMRNRLLKKGEGTVFFKNSNRRSNDFVEKFRLKKLKGYENQMQSLSLPWTLYWRWGNTTKDITGSTYKTGIWIIDWTRILHQSEMY